MWGVPVGLVPGRELRQRPVRCGCAPPAMHRRHVAALCCSAAAFCFNRSRSCWSCRAIDYETEGQQAAILAAIEDASVAVAAEEEEEQEAVGEGSDGEQQPAGAAAVAELSEQGQEEEGEEAAEEGEGEVVARCSRAAELAGGSKRRRLSPRLAEEGPAAGMAAAKAIKRAALAGKGMTKAPAGGRKAAAAAARSRKVAAAGGASSGALPKKQAGAAAAAKKQKATSAAAAAATVKKEAAAAAKRAAREQAAADAKKAQGKEGKSADPEEEEEEAYEVEGILAVKGRGKGRRLHIK